MVGLDAMRAGKHEDAEAIWDQLDEIEPGWQERVAHPDRDLSYARKRNTHRRFLAWVLLCTHQTSEVKDLFDVSSPGTVRMLANGGANIVEAKFGRLGMLEEDFEPEDVRRAKRRAEHEREWFRRMHRESTPTPSRRT